MRSGKLKLLVPIVIVLLAAVYFIWRSSRPELPEFLQSVAKEQYNVVLITVDTIRADRLGCYGFQDIQTPNIDALAASGTLFLDGTAHVPLTLPSHTSIHTGHFPSFHGIHDNGGFYVSKSQTTLAELFKQKGFATGAFVGAYVLDSIWGLDQGFDTYSDNFEISKQKRFSLGSVQRKGDDVLKNALDWLGKNKEKRFFLWTHFYDPHTPYEPPKEYEMQYPDRPYVGEIAYTDSVIGKLLDYLDQNQLREKTIILLTGDHGESLGEHDESTHAIFIYDSTLRVPMILAAPEKFIRGKRIQQQARSIDIAPTLLQLAGIPVPEDVQGRSLLHLIWNEQSPSTVSYAEAYYSQYHYGWSRLLSLRTSEYKYIDAPKPELYALKSDPGETQNVYDSKREIAKRMKSQLIQIENEKQHDAAMRPGAVDAEVHEKLAALGYVGAFIKTSTADPTNLADPKDKIWMFNMIQDAQEASLDEKPEEAIALCKKVLEIDPGIVDAQFLLGNEYYRSKQYPLALEAFKKTLELKPDYDAAIVNLANTYRRMGKMEEALAGFQHYLQKKPDNAQILYLVGELYLAMDRPDDALASFQKATVAEPDTSWIYNGIGAVHYKQKDYLKAEQFFRKALELNPETAMAHFNLAQLYEKLGQMDRAIQEYRAELDVAPQNLKANFNLGRFYMNEGDIDSGIKYLQTAIEAEPEFAIGHLFLAQAFVEKGDLTKAKEFAEKGLSLNPDPEYRPLGHFVLADIYNRQGRYDLEQQELRRANH
jgi:arylsulfatase A-like enzyme/Tfp pilus assembly protein PilF